MAAQAVRTLPASLWVACGFSRYNFKGKILLFLWVLPAAMIPLEILMLSMYTQSNDMGLCNSYAGMMPPFPVNVSAGPFFKQFLGLITMILEE